MFDLAKVPGINVKEIKSLDNAKWAVQEFCKIKSMQPLWTLLHVPNISHELKDAINDLIYIFEQENPSVDKIKAVYKKLKLDNVPLNIILTDMNNYQIGFRAFVNSIEEAPIRPEWWDEMLDTINTLQSEIAFRQETTVRQKIVAFYIKKTAPQSSANPVPPVVVNTTASTTQNNISKISEAKNKIKSINMPNMFWQKLALDLLDEHPELADYFANLNI